MSDFHGVFPYLVSPIDASGHIRETVLARLCDDLIAVNWVIKLVGWAKRSVPTIQGELGDVVGTALTRLCPPYDSLG